VPDRAPTQVVAAPLPMQVPAPSATGPTAAPLALVPITAPTPPTPVLVADPAPPAAAPAPPPHNPYIAAIICDHSTELGDTAHRAANVTQALRLYVASGHSEATFVARLHTARARVRAYQGKQGWGVLATRWATTSRCWPICVGRGRRRRDGAARSRRHRALLGDAVEQGAQQQPTGQSEHQPQRKAKEERTEEQATQRPQPGPGDYANGERLLIEGTLHPILRAFPPARGVPLMGAGSTGCGGPHKTIGRTRSPLA
ncbi:MAG: hypothetical protein M3Z04_23145, partial [Chloroflexota bacterium]|nr:hypothetical protein [Chloroflexota bacterium]